MTRYRVVKANPSRWAVLAQDDRGNTFGTYFATSWQIAMDFADNERLGRLHPISVDKSV